MLEFTNLFFNKWHNSPKVFDTKETWRQLPDHVTKYDVEKTSRELLKQLEEGRRPNIERDLKYL